MLKQLVSTFIIFLIVTVNLIAQSFPADSVILEQQTVTVNRQLVLWIKDPSQHPRIEDEEIYTCPAETRGSYYSGKVNVSLVDLKSKKIINTIEIVGHGIFGDDNNLDIPYWIHRGYYEVPKIDERKEGKPLLLNFKDFNNDGKPYEFPLFDAISCMGLPSTLIGYSQKQDKVIQYRTELKTPEGTTKRFWIDYFFIQKPDEKGVWKYEIDYRGRGGTLDKYEIQYNKETEMFSGTRITIEDEN